MKVFLMLLLSGLLACSLDGKGQAVSPNLTGSRVFTHVDTLQALHDLFLSNRRRGRTLTALVPVLVGATAYSVSQVEIEFDIWGTGSSDDTSGLPIIGAFAGGLGSLALAVFGPRTWLRNTKEREQSAVALYEQRKPLPPRLQRQLHQQLGKLLHQPAPVAKQ